MSKPKNESRFTLRVPTDLLERFAEMAHRHQRSINGEIITLIENALKNDRTSKVKEK